MALTRLPSFTIDSTSSFTFANVTVTSNVAAANANLGNAATANYFIGSGNNLSNIQVANITGIGNLATVNKDGNSSNILYGNGVFATAPVTYGNSNVSTFLASFGSNSISTTGNITANVGTLTRIANIAVGNVKITGGSNGQLLQTDGTGNLNFVTPTGTTITVDNFTANGVQTAYTLSTTPTSAAYTMVALAGTLQPRSIYSVSGNVLTFSSAPPNTAPIEVTTFSTVMGFGSGGGGGGAVNSVNSQTGTVVLTTDNIAEGTSNLYFSNSRARTAISATGSLSYSNSTGVLSYTQGNTDSVTEGSTNLYFSNARARTAISSNGSGPITYSSSTGVIDLPASANITANVITANTVTGNISSSITNLTVNTLTANSVVNSGSGTPTLQSATSIVLQAATVVRSSTSAFQFYTCTTTVRDAIAASNGYVIYNTTTNKLQVYANGVWVDLH
jgi:hypothetical protein